MGDEKKDWTVRLVLQENS